MSTNMNKLSLFIQLPPKLKSQKKIYNEIRAVRCNSNRNKLNNYLKKKKKKTFSYL